MQTIICLNCNFESSLNSEYCENPACRYGWSQDNHRIVTRNTPIVIDESFPCECDNSHILDDHENYNEGDGNLVGHCLVVGCGCDSYKPKDIPEYDNSDDFPLSLEYDEMGADDFSYL